MYKPGDVILTYVQFADSFEIKKRPAVVLFSEADNFIVAGITSNKLRTGIPVTIKEGAIKDSVIRIDYIYTVSQKIIDKKLFTLTKGKKELLFKELNNKILELLSS